MGVTTTSTLDDLMQPTIAEARLWFQQSSLFYPKEGVAREFISFADLRGKGAVAHTFPKLSSVAFGDGSAGSDYTATSALTTSGVTVTAARKVLNIPIEDLVAMGNVHGEQYLISTVGKAVGMAAARKFDADVCALFPSLTAYATYGNASNSPMTAAEFRGYVHGLQIAEVPGPYCAIFHPWGYKEFLDESSSPLLNAAASDARAKEVWNDFYLTDLFGVKLFQHPSVTSDGTDRVGAFMSPWAIGCSWLRDVEIRPQRDESAGWTEMVADMYYGVGVVDATAGYQMLQDAD